WVLRFCAFWLHQIGASRGGARSGRPLRNAWKARDRMARHFCGRVNCSALLAKPRRKTAAAASALAAGFALACELVTRIVVSRRRAVHSWAQSDGGSEGPQTCKPFRLLMMTSRRSRQDSIACGVHLVTGSVSVVAEGVFARLRSPALMRAEPERD